MFITDDQPFLPINPFAEPTTTAITMSNPNHNGTDEDMIDIDYGHNNNNKSNSQSYYQQQYLMTCRTCRC
jgi:hypothetical protein